MTNIVLQASDLTKRYGHLVAVNNLSLEIGEGEVFGFLGPNGAGKTTAINMMCGLLSPDSGHVSIYGRSIFERGTETRMRVGVCPQEIVLWKKMTCLEQLQFIGEMYGLKAPAARQRGEGLLEILDLYGKRHKLVKTLSGGMQRRLNLAMALVHDPEILILDEPEAGLDPQSRLKVREYIKSLAQQKTIILTTHNMDEAERLADRVAIIDRGQLLVVDSPEALKRTVGDGDVLEIVIRGDRDQARVALADITHRATLDFADGRLHVRALDVVNMIPVILERLAHADIQSGEVRLRENTLEDVFIRLTGRRLRE